jgi:hypothetical protein
MADIATYPLVRHLRGTPTLHVRHLRRGRLVHDGTGLAFFFRPLSAVLSEVPVDDRELPLLFHARTADFHDLTVQASVTFRVTDPATACARVDFSIDPKTGRWRGTPLEQLAGLLAETAQQQVLGLIAASPMDRLLADGIEQIRDRILRGLTSDTRLAETGIAVIGTRVVALRPEPDVEKALQTPARELLQQEADRATYERRALAVERERRSPRTSCRTRSSWPGARSSWSPRAVRTHGCRRRRPPEPAGSTRRRRHSASSGWRRRGRRPPKRSARPRRPPRPRWSRRTRTCRTAACSRWRLVIWLGTCPRSAASRSRPTCSPAWPRR